MPKRRLAALSITAVLLAACSSGATPTPSGAASPGSSAAASGGVASPSASAALGDPTKDKLAAVLASGTLVLSTDPAYPPQSEQVTGATRPADTKCQPSELTAAEVQGYDADTGKAVATALGVEPCFVVPPWSEIIAGNWGDHWDVAWGSGALTADRMTRLWVTQPYYSTPNVFFVPTNSTATTPADLSGKQVGACTGCTMEQYLEHTLTLPGVTLDYAVTPSKVVTYDAEPPGLKATAAHEIDGFLCSAPVGQEAISSGEKLKQLDTPAYFTQKTGYLDRGSSLSQTAFAAKIDQIIAQLHADGTLKALSMKWFGTDYATAAGAFDISSLGQQVQ